MKEKKENNKHITWTIVTLLTFFGALWVDQETVDAQGADYQITIANLMLWGLVIYSAIVTMACWIDWDREQNE